MTVEENLLMGGYIKDKTEEAYAEAKRVLEKYERLNKRKINLQKFYQAEKEDY